MKSLPAATVLGALLLAASATPSFGACVNTKCSDTNAIEQARGIIQSACGCTREGQTHNEYSKCVKSALKLDNVTALIPGKACRKLILRCENASICGRPNAAVCCVQRKNGTVKASIVGSSTNCRKGSACGVLLGPVSKFDACAPDGGCAGLPTTTTTTTSTTLSTTTTTMAAVCGNSVVESPEQCDPPGPNSHSCLAGSSAGTFLNCNSSCQCTSDCPSRTDNPSFPTQLKLTVPPTGSDMDNGWTGSSHNFPIVNGSTLKYCLSNCDGTSDTLCDGAGTTGEGSLNGPQFGAPLPLLSANVPVCVINRYQTSPITTIYDLATGQGASVVNLFADVYLTNNPTEVCPRCNPTGAATIGGQGKCSQTARTPGASCTINGAVKVALGAGDQQYYLSGSCIAAASQLTATLDIKLPLTTGEASPLTVPLPCGDSAGPQLQSDDCDTGTCTEGACTGTACLSGSGTNCVDAKGGISQACCSNKTSTPCFTDPITRSGKPATSGTTGAFAATFCIARTNSTLINTVTGLPGPGALVLPVEVEVAP